MIKNKSLWAKIMLVLLTLCGLYSVYSLSFCVWMTAYYTTQPFLKLWQTWAYIWMTESALVVICWLALLGWLIWQAFLPRGQSPQTK